MVRRIALVAMLTLCASGEAWAADARGNYDALSLSTCAKYLDAYSKTTLTGDATYKGPYEAWSDRGWVNGYLTAYNRFVSNGKVNIKEGTTFNDVHRWLASWCRDNKSNDLDDAVFAFIRSQQ
jgi:hypothetical protein